MKIKPEELIKYINCAAIAMDANGYWFAYTEIPTIKQHYYDIWFTNNELYLAIWDNDDKYGINIDYDGDWKDSLTLKQPEEPIDKSRIRNDGSPLHDFSPDCHDADPSLSLEYRLGVLENKLISLKTDFIELSVWREYFKTPNEALDMMIRSVNSKSEDLFTLVEARLNKMQKQIDDLKKPA